MEQDSKIAVIFGPDPGRCKGWQIFLGFLQDKDVGYQGSPMLASG